jgi:hypothetical protein
MKNDEAESMNDNDKDVSKMLKMICENEIECDDDDWFRWALIRNVEIRDVEIREAENINKRIDAICLK